MNKLGISEQKMDTLERKIVTVKLENLDETITFNCDRLDFEYLKKLHKYLFSDLHTDELTDTRHLTEEEKELINKMLYMVNRICINEPESIRKIIDILHEIWRLQPFLDGNTRTLIGYLIMLKECYYLDIPLDVHNDLRGVITAKKLELTRKS